MVFQENGQVNAQPYHNVDKKGGKVERIFKQIEGIYHTINVYKSVILFNSDDNFAPLKRILIDNDYSLTSEVKNGRMYDININTLNDSSIDWDTISLIICLDDQSYVHVKELNRSCNNFNLIIRI